MANFQIKKYADAVNQQVAAEAFWGKSGARPAVVLADGNKNKSIEPNKIIDDFDTDKPATLRYKAVAHIELSANPTTAEQTGTTTVKGKTGLSATLFYDQENSQYTLSIRSTEYADSIKDPLDVTADSSDILRYGWAFGQVQSLENFWVALLNGTAGSAGPNKDGMTVRDTGQLAAFRAAMAAGATKVDVTGYSLGANIASAFTELHRSEVGQTYLLNGAGTGQTKAGNTFSSVWNRFKQAFSNPVNPATLAG